MTDTSRVEKAVFNAIDDYNEQVPQMPLDKSRDTPLAGTPETPFDSVALVNFIVAVEDRIAEEFDSSITLASDKAMSRRQNPFQTVETLIAFVTELLEEEGNA